MTNYVPPIHTERNETPPWDGCWCMALAMGIDAATGGRIIVNESAVRWAAGNPDRPGVGDGGNAEDQLEALGKLAPKVRSKPTAKAPHDYPTASELRAHLANGGGAAISGWQSNAPLAQRKYDTRFYDRKGANGHGIYVQGRDSVHVDWLDPLMPADTEPSAYTIADVLKFAWGDAGKRIAILFWPATVSPPETLGRVRVKGAWWDYDIAGTAPAYHIGRNARVTRGYSAALGETRIGSEAQPFMWGGKPRIFARVVSGAYMGSWVDLNDAGSVTYLP